MSNLKRGHEESATSSQSLEPEEEEEEEENDPLNPLRVPCGFPRSS